MKRSAGKYRTACGVSLLLFAMSCSPKNRVREPRPHQEVAAVSAPERNAYSDDLQGAPTLYVQAVDNLRSRQLADARLQLERFLKQEPASRWTIAARVNLGLALQSLELWSEALLQYRVAAVSGERAAPALQITALYGMVGCYEALGDDRAAIAALHDLLNSNRRAALPPEFAQAELPGRLAAAYSRIGNSEASLEYYNIAEAGISAMRARQQDKPAKWLGQTLYLVGRISLDSINWQNFETVLRVLDRSQMYLVQAAELAQQPWSEQAAQDLIGTYRNLWTVIENPPASSLSDPVLAERDIQEKKWTVAGMLLDELQLLKAYELPPPERTSPSADKIFAFADELQKKINAVLMKQPAGEGLTPESLQRRETIRGRVMHPDSTLEGQYLREHEEKKTLPATSLPDESDKATEVSDPNL